MDLTYMGTARSRGITGFRTLWSMKAAGGWIDYRFCRSHPRLVSTR